MAAPFLLDKWAYEGTDSDSGVYSFPLTSENAAPALVVWLTLTTSENLASDLGAKDDQTTPDAQLKLLSDKVNLTQNCIKSLRKQFSSPATQQGTQVAASVVTDAFELVQASLHSINGGPQGTPVYPPDNCPRLAAVLLLAESLTNFVPTPRAQPAE